MKLKTVPDAWLQREGRRLDCGPYMSGVFEAKVRLEKLRARKEPLGTLTKGHNGGIFNGPRFSRNWVRSAEHGVPFVGSSSMLVADLSRLPLLRRQDAHSTKLSHLRLDPQMTLISCSGTTGRMVYVWPDMAGCWSSQHIMKVVPDSNRIPPGYLYAYLSSRFGVPLVVGGTYGAIIQHIEPHQIAGLPVPRLEDSLERETHELVEKAASKRAAACRAQKDGVALLESATGLPPLDTLLSPTMHSVTIMPSGRIQTRFDAFFHSLYHQHVLHALSEASGDLRSVEEIADQVVERARFKRIEVDDPDYGIPFFGTSALMWADPVPSYLLSRGTWNLSDYMMAPNTLLIPRSGQLSGIIGAAVLPYGSVADGAVSEDAIRVYCSSEDVAGLLFVGLTSEYGRRQLKARAYGSSIPHLDVNQIRQVLIPLPTKEVRSKIAKLGASTAKLRHEAIQLEHQARLLVEQAIEDTA